MLPCVQNAFLCSEYSLVFHFETIMKHFQSQRIGGTTWAGGRGKDFSCGYPHFFECKGVPVKNWHAFCIYGNRSRKAGGKENSMHPEMTPYHVVIHRGGTSKGIFIRENELPADPEQRAKVIRGIFGTPDKR